MVKAIILSAGVGRRLEGAMGGLPKSLIDLGGETMIEKQIDILNKYGISKIAVIVGYMKDKIKEKLGDRVTYFFNPFFETTNNVTSLWFANDFLQDEDVIIINGDIIIEPSIMQDLLENEGEICVLVDIGKYNELGYKIKVKDNFVDFMGMHIDKSEVAGEYAGISKVSKQTLPLLVKKLEDFMMRKEFGTWYETAYVELIKDGVKISFVDTNRRSWLEIDTPDDIEKAKQYFNL